MCDDYSSDSSSSDYSSDSSGSDYSPSLNFGRESVIEEIVEDDFDTHVHVTKTHSITKGNKPMSSIFDRMNNAAAGTHGATLDFSKAQSVDTAQRINFSKDNPGVNKIRMELYWESENDGDASVLIMGADGKALPGTKPGSTNPNHTRGMVWYNNDSVPGVLHSGDVTSSTDGDPTQPEETIKIDLNGLEADADAVLAVASTYPDKNDPQKRPVAFGKLRNCIVLIVNDETNEVLYTYELDEDFSTHTSVELAKFYKRNGEWRFTSMGEGVGTSAEALSDIARKYGLA